MLEYEKIEKDPGLRPLAKMMLNSMWGKFGQRPNKTQVKEFVDPVEFHKFLDSVKYDVRYVGVINDSRVEVHCQHEVEDNPVSPNLEGPLKVSFEAVAREKSVCCNSAHVFLHWTKFGQYILRISMVQFMTSSDHAHCHVTGNRKMHLN